MRKIVKELRFELELRDLLGVDARGADEFIEATEWVLMRRPNVGSLTTTDDPPVYFLPIASVDRVTPLILFYTFDDEAIHLLSIKVAVGSSN